MDSCTLTLACRECYCLVLLVLLVLYRPALRRLLAGGGAVVDRHGEE